MAIMDVYNADMALSSLILTAMVQECGGKGGSQETFINSMAFGHTNIRRSHWGWESRICNKHMILCHRAVQLLGICS